jgi:hypothetical protein
MSRLLGAVSHGPYRTATGLPAGFISSKRKKTAWSFVPSQQARGEAMKLEVEHRQKLADRQGSRIWLGRSANIFYVAVVVVVGVIGGFFGMR